MKENVSVPVISAGRMDDPGLAVKAVSEGACDVVSLGRPLLADPDYVNKLRADKIASIRPSGKKARLCLRLSPGPARRRAGRLALR